MGKQILKFTWKCKVPRVVKITLKKKNIVGKLMLPISVKLTVIKTVVLTKGQT
jgi:hypothetical protein